MYSGSLRTLSHRHRLHHFGITCQTKPNQTAHDSEKGGWNATHYSCTSETLWRKLNNLKPSFSHNKELYVFKRGKRKCSCIRGQILLTRNKNHRKSVCVWNMWNKSHLLCQEKKKLMGTSRILALGESRVLFSNSLFSL